MNRTWFGRTFPLVCLIILLTGCAEEKNTATHPKGWLDSDSDNFHALKIAVSGLESCAECHADTCGIFFGGTSGISCYTCHDGGESGHPPLLEWISPSSADYHGRIFWENGWDFSGCQECHGENLNAGGTIQGCQTAACHIQSGGIYSCANCHSYTLTAKDAFFYDVKNNYSPDTVSVGTHRSHLLAVHGISDSLNCSDCHTMPTSIFASGHLDTTQNIDFGELAMENGKTPLWNRATATCSDVYCHLNSTPVWTENNSAYSTCQGCHTGFDTSDAHPAHVTDQNYDCSVCHDGYSLTAKTVVISSHIDGEKDIALNETYGGTFTSGTCSDTYCHGVAVPDWAVVDGTWSACGTCHALPPASGAHATHVTDEEIDCGTCHSGYSTTTATVFASTHINLTVEVDFPTDIGGTYDDPSSTCSNVYCHSGSTVSWTDADLTCGSCHAIPPASGAHATHVSTENYDCEVCHTGYSAISETTSESDHINQLADVAIATAYLGSYDSANESCNNVYCHSDVTVNWDGSALGCGDCHALPPASGAHTTHSTDLALDCSYCHAGYTSTSTSGSDHINLLTDVTIYATGGGTYDSNSGTCADVRCHGSQSVGWTDSPTFTCTSCHADTSSSTFYDLDGETNVTSAGVGAHTMHLSENDFHVALECSDCHTYPATSIASGHFDPDLIAEINFDVLATDSGTVTPVWDSGTGTCVSVYCHGNFAFLKSESANNYAYDDTVITGNNPTLAWATGTNTVCGDCHAYPPTGHKDYTAMSIGCSNCHPAIVNSDNTTIADKQKHINLLKNLTD